MLTSIFPADWNSNQVFAEKLENGIHIKGWVFIFQMIHQEYIHEPMINQKTLVFQE